MSEMVMYRQRQHLPNLSRQQTSSSSSNGISSRCDNNSNNNNNDNNNGQINCYHSSYHIPLSFMGGIREIPAEFPVINVQAVNDQNTVIIYEYNVYLTKRGVIHTRPNHTSHALCKPSCRGVGVTASPRGGRGGREGVRLSIHSLTLFPEL